MSYAPGAPPEVWALTGIDDGAKFTLAWLWSRADHDVQRDPRPTEVRVAARFDDDGDRLPPGLSLVLTIQECVHPTKSLRTIRGHLTRLRKLGLADAHGRFVDLTPPVLATDGQNVPQMAGHTLPVDGHSSPQTGHTLPVDGHSSPIQLGPPVPSSPPSPGEDARPTSGKPAPQVSNARARPLDTRLPARLPPVHTPQLPAHVEAELARAKREQAPGAIGRAEILADAHGFSPGLMARIEATSQAAHVALMTSGCTTHLEAGKCWAALMALNIVDRGMTDDQVIRVLEHWELARAGEQPKPPMTKLWWRGKLTSGFVDEALGADSQPAQPRKPMQPARTKVVLPTPSWAPKSALAGGQP